MGEIKKIGYNSYGVMRPLIDIYNSEKEKGNIPVIRFIKSRFKTCISMYNIRAIWVTYSPIECFKFYCLSAEYYDYSDDCIAKLFPNYMDEIFEVNLDNMICIFEDTYAGYLYVTSV